MEDCFALSLQPFAHLQLPGVLSDGVDGGGCPQLWPADDFAVCAVSRHWHFSGADWTYG